MAGVDRQAVAAIATLDDDVRRALFACVRDAAAPVTREAAARTVGVSTKLAAFHLDKLVAAGLLRSRIAPAGRVGRAPKVYEPSSRAVWVSLPQREHELLAEILLAAVQHAGPGETSREAALRIARGRGEQDGAALRAQHRPGRLGVERAATLAAAMLGERGFEPVRDGTRIRLRNCPFHPLAQSAPDVVCGINHAYLRGMLHGLGAEAALDAVLDPVPGQCCVAITPRSN